MILEFSEATYHKFGKCKQYTCIIFTYRIWASTFQQRYLYYTLLPLRFLMYWIMVRFVYFLFAYYFIFSLHMHVVFVIDSCTVVLLFSKSCSFCYGFDISVQHALNIVAVDYVENYEALHVLCCMIYLVFELIIKSAIKPVNVSILVKFLVWENITINKAGLTIGNIQKYWPTI